MNSSSGERVADGKRETDSLMITFGDIQRLVFLRIHKEAEMDRMGLDIATPFLARSDHRTASINNFWKMARDGYRWQLRMDRIRACKGIDPQRIMIATLSRTDKRSEQKMDLSVYDRAFTTPVSDVAKRSKPSFDLSIFEKAFVTTQSDTPHIIDPRETASYYQGKEEQLS